MIELPFNSLEFIDAWQDYIEQKKKPYKNERSMKAGLKKLVRLSHNNEEIAIAILENAIEGNWQGFFPLDDRDPLMLKLKSIQVNHPKTLAQKMKQDYGIS